MRTSKLPLVSSKTESPFSVNEQASVVKQGRTRESCVHRATPGHHTRDGGLKQNMLYIVLQKEVAANKNTCVRLHYT